MLNLTMTKTLALLLWVVNVNSQTPKKEYVEMLSSKHKVNLCVIIPFKAGSSNTFFSQLMINYFLTTYRQNIVIQ
jgi:hypothetical protein